MRSSNQAKSNTRNSAGPLPLVLAIFNAVSSLIAAPSPFNSVVPFTFEFAVDRLHPCVAALASEQARPTLPLSSREA